MDHEALATQLVRALAAGELTALTSRFDEAMAAAMSEADLGALFGDLERRVGAYQGIVETRKEPHDGLVVVDVVTSFERAPLAIRLAFDGEGRIAGLFLRPAAQDGAYEPPPYAAADRYREENVTVGGPPYPLPGTLTLPSPGPPGGAPALVLVHGSGPQDRDTTLGPNKPFADLALGLASRGIAVLRYDKRTKVHGQAIARAVANGEPFTLREETVEDALAAAALLRGHAAIDPDRVFVLGHSLGGTAIPRIAAGDAEIAGFVLLAAASERLEDAIVRQHRYIAELDGQLSDEERALLEKSEALAREVKALRDPAAGPIHGIPAGYWLDLAAHPPLHEIASVRRPLLVLQGGRDYQVTDAAFASWREALASHPRATFTRYPTLNHLFIAGEGPSRPEEYLKPGHVAEAVIDDIAAFVSGGAKRGP